MGYEAMTGRLPDAVALHFLETGLVGHGAGGPQADREGPRGDPDRGRPGSAPGTSSRARTRCRAATAPSGRSARRAPPAEPDDAAARRGRARGDRRRASRAARAGRWSRPTTWTCSGAMPDGVVDLAYADPPFATGKAAAPGVDPDRRAGSGRGAGSAAASHRYEAVSDLAWDDGLPLDEHLAALEARVRRGPPRARAARVALPPRATGGPSTTSGCCSTRCSAPERFLNELVWAYDYGGRAARPLAAQARHDPVVREGRPTWRSSATRSTGSRTSRPGSSARRRPRAASCRPTCGG